MDKEDVFMDEPWTVKYMPKILDDIVGQYNAIDLLKHLSEREVISCETNEETIRIRPNIPNILLVGPTGVGKTSTAECFSKAILGSDYNSNWCIEMNASSERRASDMRLIEPFIMDISKMPFKNTIGAPIPYKVIIFDECDHMQPASQKMLKGIMDRHQERAKFILTCNDPNPVLKDIKSRCNRFDFNPIPPEAILQRLLYVIKSEGNIKLTRSGAESILYISNGDMRVALNTLQAAHSFSTTSDDRERPIDDRIVFSVSDPPHPADIYQMLNMCLCGNIDEAFKISAKLCKTFSTSDILEIMVNIAKLIPTNNNKGKQSKIKSVSDIEEELSVNPFIKDDIIKEIMETHAKIIQFGDSASSSLPIDALLSKIHNIVFT